MQSKFAEFMTTWLMLAGVTHISVASAGLFATARPSNGKVSATSHGLDGFASLETVSAVEGGEK